MDIIKFKQGYIIRPIGMFQGYSLSSKSPNSKETGRCSYLNLEEPIDFIRKTESKLLYISDLPNPPYRDELEMLTAGPEDITWEPHLSREEVKEIFKSEDSFHKYLSKGQDPVEPKNIEELLEYGVRLGGVVMFAPAVARKLKTNQPLEFENSMNPPFKIKLSEELAKKYCNRYSEFIK